MLVVLAPENAGTTNRRRANEMFVLQVMSQSDIFLTASMSPIFFPRVLSYKTPRLLPRSKNRALPSVSLYCSAVLLDLTLIAGCTEDAFGPRCKAI